MADSGKLYTGFDMEYVEAMKELCKSASIILPNITEACLMTGMKYRESYDERYVRKLMERSERLCNFVVASIKLFRLSSIYFPGLSRIALDAIEFSCCLEAFSFLWTEFSIEDNIASIVCRKAS